MTFVTRKLTFFFRQENNLYNISRNLNVNVSLIVRTVSLAYVNSKDFEERGDVQKFPKFFALARQVFVVDIFTKTC